MKGQFIETFNITCMSVVIGVHADFSEEEVLSYLKVPVGCGPIIKVRVNNDRCTEYRPTCICC